MKFPRYAKLRYDGSMIVVKRAQDFKPHLMEWVVLEEKPVVEKVEEVVENPVENSETMEIQEVIDAKKARFEELKAKKAWLHKATKEEYAELKAIYG